MKALLTSFLFITSLTCVARLQSVVADSAGGGTWFNDQYFVTAPGCEFATIHRVAKYNQQLKAFDGDFTDYNKKGTTLLTGSYRNGKKEGVFKGYFTNGYLRFEGHYKLDQPDGTWYFYYSDGRPLTILSITDGKINILEHWNIQDRQAVKQGEGKYSIEIPAYGFNKDGYNSIVYSGKIRNGLPDGEWRTEYVIGGVRFVQLVEKFVVGRLVSSQAPGSPAVSGAVQQTEFLPRLYFANAETLQTKPCRVDDQLNYTAYLKEYFENGLKVIKKDLDTGQIQIQVGLSVNGRPLKFNIQHSINAATDRRILALLRSVNYFIPSKRQGATINDSLTLSFTVQKNDAGDAVVSLPVIERQNGS